MNDLDLYYRIYGEYLKAIRGNKSSRRMIEALKRASKGSDRLEAIRTKCTVDESWIEALEAYLPYVEKAIREDRQFIRQEGETIPVERARRVSRDSVMHLARHGNLITEEPKENGEIVPEKIYVVENESNYAIYENRFLYMLLCYARDFVELRYQKISELGNTYTADFRLKKHVEHGKKTIDFDLKFHEVSRSDPLATEDFATNRVIERIESIRVFISTLLMTPLMNEVAKTPLLKPPISRTNILKMNVNFKAAVKLYDFLAAYPGAGYETKEQKKTFSPLTEELESESLEIVPLISYLSYRYGNELHDVLRASFQREEERRHAEELAHHAEELKELRQRCMQNELPLEEYLLRLERYNAVMEQKLTDREAAMLRLQKSIDTLDTQNKLLTESENHLREELENAQQQLLDTVAAHKLALEAQREEAESNVALLRTQHGEMIAELQKKHGAYIEEAENAHRARLEEERERYGQKEREASELGQRCEELSAASIALQARIHALQAHAGIAPDEDLTEREHFLMLERERAWFESVFQDTWKKTKKRIRREILFNSKSTTPKTDAEKMHFAEDDEP